MLETTGPLRHRDVVDVELEMLEGIPDDPCVVVSAAVVPEEEAEAVVPVSVTLVVFDVVAVVVPAVLEALLPAVVDVITLLVSRTK